ncbi:MAG: hypothetical protein AB1589_18630 [Cyanobacteriota bacterium]
MDQELQELLEEYQQLESNLLVGINQLTRKPEYLPEVPLGRLFYIKSLLSSGGGTGGGDATAANQTTQIGLETTIRDSVTDLAGRLPPALIEGRLPVDVQSLSVTVNNASLEIANDSGNPIPVNGTVAISSLPALTTGSNVIGSIANTTFASTQSGIWNINNITGTIPLPTLAATSTLQDTANTSLSSIDNRIGNITIKASGVTSVATDTAIVVTQRPEAIAPTLSAITLTLANTEYSISVSAAKKLSFKVLSGGGVRYAYTAGRVAASTLPYYTLEAGVEESEDLLERAFTGTLYFASAIGGAVVLLKQWS